MELPRSFDRFVNSLPRDFFRRDPVCCARELIGCRLSLGSCGGVIVETEAYAAEGDKACHTWKRQSARDFVAGHRPGAAYVYLNYGMHWLLNFLVKGGEQDGFVLIRALEPVTGIELMSDRRRKKSPGELCNGPAKLTQAFGITGSYHGCDPLDDENWKLYPPLFPVEVVDSTRIGISQATDLRWRFLLKGSRAVSVAPWLPSAEAKRKAGSL